MRWFPLLVFLIMLGLALTLIQTASAWGLLGPMYLLILLLGWLLWGRIQAARSPRR